MASDRVQVLANGLRQSGLRLTHQRLAICRTLVTSNTHPTAVQLHTQLRAEFPTLSLATVYSTLNTLAALGLVYELGNAGDGQKHYDAITAPHANLICTQCHRISDFEDTALKSVSQHVARRSGYQIQGARIAYYGICPACARRRGR
ncbi:MAG: transcriptional repressor [Chloroflexi bacterium]|nr:transcriptional repressor [Chloroflexota bacterium]